MDTEQTALGEALPHLLAQLESVDWQIGVTTTDVSVGSWGTRGSLLGLADLTQTILRPTTPNRNLVLKTTVQRPETFGCIPKGSCPSGLEQPLRAIIQTMDKHATENAGFFRPDADLSILILSDEDEMSDGRPGSTDARDVLDRARALWPRKRVLAHALVIVPADAACLAAQGAQFGATAYYGTKIVALANLTGGVVGSICAPDYSQTITHIGQRTLRLRNSINQ
jgi:hypothetical protein